MKSNDREDQHQEEETANLRSQLGGAVELLRRCEECFNAANCRPPRGLTAFLRLVAQTGSTGTAPSTLNS